MSDVPQWAAAQLYCREQMDGLIADQMERNRPIPWTGVTDEATFMMSWIPHYLFAGNREHLEYMLMMRDRWLAWNEEGFHHGYYPSHAEEHHHTENYIRFLGRLWMLDPWDGRNVGLLEHFAHHLGNWEPGCPAWYDWQKHRFVSRFMGTRTVSDLPEHNHNSVGFFRYVNVLLLTHLATGDPEEGHQHYLDLALDYADAWMRFYDKHLADDPLPTHADENWDPTTPEAPNTMMFYGSGMLRCYLDLHAITGAEKYAAFVRRMLDRLLKEFARNGGPRYWARLRGALAQYRRQTGDTFLDETVLESVNAVKAESRSPEAFALSTRPADWGPRALSEDGTLQPVAVDAPGALAFAYQISGDVELAARAMRAAGRTVQMIRPFAEEGRKHGCGYPSITGFVNSAVLESLYPLAIGMYNLGNRGATLHRPAVTFAKPTGAIGLPPNVAALYHPDDAGTVRLFNASDASIVTAVNRHPLQPQPMLKRSRRPLGRAAFVSVTLPPGREVVLRLPEGENPIKEP